METPRNYKITVPPSKPNSWSTFHDFHMVFPFFQRFLSTFPFVNSIGCSNLPPPSTSKVILLLNLWLKSFNLRTSQKVKNKKTGQQKTQNLEETNNQNDVKHISPPPKCGEVLLVVSLVDPRDTPKPQWIYPKGPAQMSPKKNIWHC